MRTNKSLKGVTSMEIVIASMAISILALFGFRTLASGFSLAGLGKNEYVIQTSMKRVSEKITNEIRYSSAVFIMPESSFREGNLSDEWNYLGMENTTVNGVNATQIVTYNWDADNSSHVKKIVIEPRADLVYDLKFHGDDITSMDNKEIYYSLIGAYADSGEEYWRLDTAAEALNALQVVDYSTASDVGRALAYRADNRDTSSSYVGGRVAMILDVSGSMINGMSGGTTRIEALKNSTVSLLEAFAKEGNNVEVCLFPFSRHANPNVLSSRETNYFQFLNTSISSEFGTLKSSVDSLAAAGTTNTGDGIRRAYHALNNAASLSSEVAPNYVIVFVDGETNTYTYRYSSITLEYTYDDSDQDATKTKDKSDTPITRWSDYNNYAYPRQYVSNMGAKLRSLPSDQKVNSLRCYLVVVNDSSSTVSQEGIDNIKLALNIDDTDVYSVSDTSGLEDAFTSIANAINSDIWYILGPGL